MFNFSGDTPPLVLLEACPVCVRQTQERTTQHLVFRQRVLCVDHRAYFEALLRNPSVPRLAVRLWLNLARKHGELEAL